MQKISQLILAVAERALAKPTERSSREAVAAALLLAHVAWNRVVDPLGGDRVGYCRTGLAAFEAQNPKYLGELKSADPEALILELSGFRRARYPMDHRIIRLCGLTEKKNVQVEWHHPGVEGTNWIVPAPFWKTA